MENKITKKVTEKNARKDNALTLKIKKYVAENNKFISADDIEKKLIEFATDKKIRELKQWATAYRLNAVSHIVDEKGKLKSLSKDDIIAMMFSDL